MDLPQTIGGKYRPRSILGTGAMGTVYSVEHTVTGELLALKVMNAHLGASPDAMARFKREARTASTVRSQHVVRIFDADVAPELGGAPFLVMDLLEGRDLEQVAGNKPVDPEEVVEWLRQIAQGVDKAHRLGIVHRDLKPENLFLTRLDDGTPLVKILDFGIAKIAAEAPMMTQSGQLFGTPLYMAPEQARGVPAQVGPSTDLFALGQIAYRLLTGVPYRAGANVVELLAEIVNEPLRAPSEKGHALGAGFDSWFLRACDPHPLARFPSAREQVEALAFALGFPREPEVAGPPSSMGPWESALRRPPTPVPDVVLPISTTMRTQTSPPARSDGPASSAPILPAREATTSNTAHRGISKRWRIAFIAASLLVALPLAGVAFSGAKPDATSAPGAAKASASAVGNAQRSAADVAPALTNNAPVPAIEIAASVDAAPAVALPALAATPERSVRLPYFRAVPPPRAVPFRKGSVDDDPLSDQK